jgi:phosphate transport system ATP-binding protein
MTIVYGIHRDGDAPPALEVSDLSVAFGPRVVVKNVSFALPPRRILAMIGPSGCGKTSLLLSLNRMNDFNPEARISGEVRLFGQGIYRPEVDPTSVRRRIGMVFQEPILFPGSIFQNVAFGPVVNRVEGDLAAVVEDALRRASLWDEVYDRLGEPATRLSRGQQQRLSIARALAVGPEVLLMDEPASFLDAVASRRIEELLRDLKETYTIVVVTQSLQQAARVSDLTAVLVEGELVEYGATPLLFTNPRNPRTEAFLTGRFG